MIAHLDGNFGFFEPQVLSPFHLGLLDTNKWLKKTISVDAIIFDMDGTRINSDYANFLAYKTALEKVVGSQPFLIYNPKIRLTREGIHKIIPSISDNDLKKVIEEKERVYSFYLSETSVNKQLLDVLCRNSNKLLILSTNSKQKRAELLLLYHGLSNKFDHKFFSDDGKSGNKYQKVMKTFLCVNIDLSHLILI